MAIKIKDADGNWKQVDGTGLSLQDFYDAFYPVDGDPVISFGAPYVPPGVSATWVADTSYDGRALWIDSTQIGSNLDGSLPKVEGSFDIAIYQTGAAIVKGQSGCVKTLGGSGSDTTKLTYGDYSSTSTKVQMKASDSNSVYNASAGTNVVRPTSICVGVYKRTA